jgi:CHAD domain-containing protein
MAAARPIPGLVGDEPFQAAAARVVSVRGEEVWEHLGRALDIEDIEGVHDMRVATRRLRAVLEIFAPCFERKRVRDVLRDVKRLADALGERRDPDVHIVALEDFAAAASEPDRPGVRVLVDRLREQQATANDRLAAALAEAERTDLQGRVRALVEETQPA